MIHHRAPTLLCWLAALLVAVLGLLAPGTAAAHAGHGHPAPMAAPAQAAEAAGGGIGAAFLAMPATAASTACTGAECCSASHGCCAAILGAATPACPGPRTARARPMRAGLPAGLAATALPEPPRPVR